MDERMLELPEKVLEQMARAMDKSCAKTFSELSNKEKEQVRKKVRKDDGHVQKEMRKKNKNKQQNTPQKRAYFNAFGEKGKGWQEGENKRDKALQPELCKLTSLPQMGLGSNDICSKLRG